jgi:hypothetical protein
MRCPTLIHGLLLVALAGWRNAARETKVDLPAEGRHLTTAFPLRTAPP